MLPRLIDKMREGYDMVIGSRYLDGAVSEDDDIVTAFGNWLFTRTVNLLYGARYSDVMVIYRAFTGARSSTSWAWTASRRTRCRSGCSARSSAGSR